MYRFIENIGDFFNPGYYTEDFINKVIALSGYDSEAVKEFNKRFSGLKAAYFDAKGVIRDQRLHRRYIIKETHDLNTKVMAALGYDTTPAYANWIHVDDSSVIPARSILYNGDQASLVVMEMQAMVKVNEDDVPQGLFEQHYDDEGLDKVIREQKYNYSHWANVIGKELPEGCKISPSKINECVSAIFLLPPKQRPKYIIIFAGNVVFLMEQDKWDHGAYLKFDLEELFSETAISANRNYYALFYLLAGKEVLAGDSQIVLMDKINEESFKNAYEVTKDLKEGVIHAVELLANEAIYYERHVLKEEFDETDESFASDVKDDCLNIIYRLLFVFYAEARPEIGILPMDDEAYAKGYSLEILRDLEQTPLKSDSSRNSYFFHDSLWQLFRLISSGYNDHGTERMSFTVKKIDSPLFDDGKLKKLGEVKYRNMVWQEIICSLSLSREQARKNRGRISYANLGVNQLGSVYESLLAYRGFYAEEDYIEVHPVGDTVETYLVPRSRMGDFKSEEILRNEKDEIVILPKGTFVYRLNGRDRKKSASYYTPEVLTKSTVKYTLKGYKDKLEAGEMKAEELLRMKILEPAMGAAAFQNEAINQMAEMYLTYRQKELGKKIAPQNYHDELQKVKAYIATKDIYGVDLNPTAIELGKLALWLNVMHKDMETPFFAHRLALGNAVIGAWFKAYDVDELYKKDRTKYICTAWWEKAPHRLHFSKDKRKILRKNNEIYHFLIPDKNMLAALQIKEEKDAHPEIARGMQNRIKDWTKPFSAEDILILKKISAKIDKLITEYIIYQEKVEKLTANNYAVWGSRTYVNSALFRYDDKENLADTRNAKTNAYHKLVTVMNYWCALWFWEYDDADRLPSREEYWSDIEQILGIDFSTGKIKDDDTLVLTSPDQEEPNLFSQYVEAEVVETVPEEEQQAAAEEALDIDTTVYTEKDAQELFATASSSGDIFESARTPIVEKLANRYHFFHPMLEFIEVFWLRDGFDVIVGNPPWIKIELDEVSIFAEKHPEFAIRKTNAADIRINIKPFLFSSDSKLFESYRLEQEDTTCTIEFLNAFCNYPLLDGQKNNLYKCILENCLDQTSPAGFIGILCPEGIYDEPNGQALREEVYKRLRYHFQYQNELKLFSEVDHHTQYGDQLLGPRSSSPNFLSINNLFHPSTVDACFAHDGHGHCGGLKENSLWNTSAHKDRIIHLSEHELKTLATTFEGDSNKWRSTRLVSIHASEILQVLEKLASSKLHVRDLEFAIGDGLRENTAVEKGIMKRETHYPVGEYEMIYNGPHFFLSNPYYKTPRSTCKLNSDYDCINLSTLEEDYYPRSNYVPLIPKKDFISLAKGFIIGHDSKGKPIYDNLIDYYRLAFSAMVGTSSERTLSGAILPAKTAHVHAVISIAFKEQSYLLEFTGLCSSLVFDFYMKTTGSTSIIPSRLAAFPIGIDNKYKSALFLRVLLLNCLTRQYSSLWASSWDHSFLQDNWSLSDLRLKDFSTLSPTWNKNTPLRNYFERRLALVEIDVITSLALGLSLEDLEIMYKIQFPVLQDYEEHTFFDQAGNIVFTSSVGLKGVGVDKKVWESIRNQKEGETYTHTIDPSKSELYGGQQVTYYAPYTKCDRIEDYRRAWAHFEKVFKDK